MKMDSENVESTKKDDTLWKYENLYTEAKARSEQKVDTKLI